MRDRLVRDGPANPRVTVIHPGTQHSKHLARELCNRELLHRFVTGLVVNHDGSLGRAVGKLATFCGYARQFENRAVSGIPGEKILTRPMLEVAAISLLRMGLRPDSVLFRRNEIFQRSISETIFRDSDVLIGFDTASNIIGGRAKRAGKRFILDQTICHPAHARSVLEAVAARYPEWLTPSDRKTDAEIAIENDEHRLADVIVAPSRFVAKTLAERGVPLSKIVVNCFGTNTSMLRPAGEVKAIYGNVTFLFLGNVSARKGVPVLLEAWRRVGASGAKLILAGTGKLPRSVARSLPDSVTVLGAVRRSELARVFRMADAFVCPSFLEGLAQVQIEAAAVGLPIVTTTASGGEDVVEHGVSGLIVPPGDVDALAAAMERLMSNQAELMHMAGIARARAHSWTWSSYGDRWQHILSKGRG